VLKRLEVGLSVVHGHFGQMAERDDLPRNQLREFQLAPGIGFPFLVQSKCVTTASNFFSVLLSIDVVIDPPATGPGWTLE
jgi:hypothetical protein